MDEIKKRILIVDVPESCHWLSTFLKRWGYETFESQHTNSDSVLELIGEKEFDLLMIAKHLTIKGPSRSGDWKEGDEIDVAFSFGMETLSRLRVRNNLPVIVLTTDAKRDMWIRDKQGKLDWVVLTRCGDEEGSFFDKLRKTVEEFLGEGIGIEE